jgi:hypothetical protein
MRNLTKIFGAVITSASLATMASDLKKIHVENGLDYSIPISSPVRFAAIDRNSVAFFHGRFVMSGTYHYGYVSSYPNSDLELFFIPDIASADRLPYWAERGHVHEIWFTNQDAFVREVIPSADVENLKSKRTLSISGKVEIVVERYQASVECDYPDYAVSFVTASQRGYELASNAVVEEYGC